MSEQIQAQSSAMDLTRAINNFTALKIRLDTQPLLEQIELFLRGAKIVIRQNEKTGRITSQKVAVGKSKANDQGVQGILNWVGSTFNAQTVQGNFPTDNDRTKKSEMYENYIQEYHIELTTLLISNAYEWEINDDEIDGIIEMILLLIIPFFTRLIDNKERESYGETIKTIENNLLRSKGGIPLFNQ